MSLKQLLGIELPLIQAPMAGVQGSALAIAVSQAGALGSLPCAMLGMEAMQHEWECIRSQTDKPFNANFFCHTAPAADAQRDAAWRTLFAGYYAELGLDPATSAPAAARLPFNREMAELVCAFKPGVVSFHFGLPAPELLAMVKRSGAKILSSATTVAEALWLEARGVDAVIAQGLEAGGHRGMFLTADISTQVGTFALLPQVVAAVKVPVIAAGGIASAQGVKAALDLGASAVQVGTAYLLCSEATTSPVHRRALVSAEAQVTALTNIFTGRPARGIVNRLLRELGPINLQAPAFPMAAAASFPLRQKAESLGLGDFSPLWAGQNTAGCLEVSARQLTRELVAWVDQRPER
jgi:nitronate monooxygenase